MWKPFKTKTREDGESSLLDGKRLVDTLFDALIPCLGLTHLVAFIIGWNAGVLGALMIAQTICLVARS